MTFGSRVPEALGRPLRRMRNSLLDFVDRARGRHDPLIPPGNARYVGVGDDRELGEHFFGHFSSVSPDFCRRIACSISARAPAGWRANCGWWGGYADGPSFQDVVIVERR
jgi:hypothetical protein